MLSEHPIGKAIVSSYKNQKSNTVVKAESFNMVIGRGVIAKVSGKKFLAGNKELLKENTVSIPSYSEIDSYLSQGCTVIHIAADNEYAGYIVLSDVLRNESKNMIASLSRLGATPVLLTDDNKNSADSIASKLGIT